MEKGGVSVSLLDSMKERCVILNHIRQDDPYGGFVNESWEPGASFDAVIIKNTTTEAQIAEKQGIKELFTVVVDKAFGLEFHDVFKRLSDGAVFRVTSMQRDSEAPDMSSVPIGKVTAERWEIPA